MRAEWGHVQNNKKPKYLSQHKSLITEPPPPTAGRRPPESRSLFDIYAQRNKGFLGKTGPVTSSAAGLLYVICGRLQLFNLCQTNKTCNWTNRSWLHFSLCACVPNLLHCHEPQMCVRRRGFLQPKNRIRS